MTSWKQSLSHSNDASDVRVNALYRHLISAHAGAAEIQQQSRCASLIAPGCAVRHRHSLTERGATPGGRRGEEADRPRHIVRGEQLAKGMSRYAASEPSMLNAAPLPSVQNARSFAAPAHPAEDPRTTYWCAGPGLRLRERAQRVVPDHRDRPDLVDLPVAAGESVHA